MAANPMQSAAFMKFKKFVRDNNLTMQCTVQDSSGKFYSYGAEVMNREYLK